METINDYLDSYARARNLTSDYQIARDLTLTRQAVSKYRHGRAFPDFDVAWRIATALDCSPAEVMAAAELERAKRANDAERIGMWRKRLATVSAPFCTAFIGVFIVSGISDQANAATLFAKKIVCILC